MKYCGFIRASERAIMYDTIRYDKIAFIYVRPKAGVS